ncbi:male sterility protein-domain-containing protein [Daldinia vernicosa]|uniref:male sterility protein-domain-containing protein n=1 Tax=Daldinia vernicosa TaxID=114800 RepID=UPI002008B9B6|nr:male sterility protein-domain-containing protein [Daldinia vernicosa]KAI0854297.1 male sterility protein-domain-containing protein [Daldinia vernicosa]
MCIQIKKLIQSSILSDTSIKLPESLIYDSGNVQALAEELIRIRNGGKFRDSCRDVDEWKLMRELIERHDHFETHNVDLIRENREVVVLTGATGMLGSHILSELCHNNRFGKMHCLLRGESEPICRELLTRALRKRKLSGLYEPGNAEALEEKTVCLLCQLSELHLGLSDDEWISIVAESTIYIHTAWSVNFSLPLNSVEFENHIRGAHDVITAALSSKARFFFISSTAAVSANPSATITEEVSLDPSHASPLGYSRSKWVAERVSAGFTE